MSAAAVKNYHLKFDSDPIHIKGIRLACEELAREVGFDDKAVDELGLCVNEAIANVVEHAYNFELGRPVEIWVEARGDGKVKEGELRIRLRDWGPGSDPSKLPVKPKDPLVPGGLGLICMREMMDSMEYAAPAEGGMLLTLVRRFPRRRG